MYRVIFHHIDRFLKAYESSFEREYGYLRPIVEEVVDKYLDCGNPKCGFAWIKCSDCGREKLLMFSCKTRGFCPSCHAKRREEWGEWMREELILDAPHRQVVFTIPKMLRIFFRYNRSLLSSLTIPKSIQLQDNIDSKNLLALEKSTHPVTDCRSLGLLGAKRGNLICPML